MAKVREAGPDLYDQSDMDDWRFRSWHVGMDEGGKNTDPITAENTLIAAGPARIVQARDDFKNQLFPIGLIENVTVNQQKMLQEVREIGSRRAYIIGSHSTGNISLSRVMYNHASLLRALTVANNDFKEIDNPPGAGGFTGDLDDYTGNAAGATDQSVWFSNLQSELFDRPIGVLFYMLDQRNEPYGAMYAEDAMVQTHNVNFASRAVAVSERATLKYDRLQPVAVSAAT